MLLSKLLYDNQSNLVSRDFKKPCRKLVVGVNVRCRLSSGGLWSPWSAKTESCYFWSDRPKQIIILTCRMNEYKRTWYTNVDINISLQTNCDSFRCPNYDPTSCPWCLFPWHQMGIDNYLWTSLQNGPCGRRTSVYFHPSCAWMRIMLKYGGGSRLLWWLLASPAIVQDESANRERSHQAVIFCSHGWMRGQPSQLWFNMVHQRCDICFVWQCLHALSNDCFVAL